MNTSTRWLFALAAVLAVAIAAVFYRTRSASDSVPAAAPTQASRSDEHLVERVAPKESTSSESVERSREVPTEIVRSFGRLELPTIGPIQDKMRQFVSEPLDPLASSGVEAQLLSAIAQSNHAVVDWHVECRTTACTVLLVYPFGTDASTVADAAATLPRSLGRSPVPTTVFFFPGADGAPSALATFGIPRESTTQSAAQESIAR